MDSKNLSWDFSRDPSGNIFQDPFQDTSGILPDAVLPPISEFHPRWLPLRIPWDALGCSGMP